MPTARGWAPAAVAISAAGAPPMLDVREQLQIERRAQQSALRCRRTSSRSESGPRVPCVPPSTDRGRFAQSDTSSARQRASPRAAPGALRSLAPARRGRITNSVYGHHLHARGRALPRRGARLAGGERAEVASRPSTTCGAPRLRPAPGSAQLFDAGYAGISWPKEYGGRGASLMEQLIWYEEFARSGAHDPSTLFVGLNHGGPTLIARGSEEQKAFHLPKILARRGDLVSGILRARRRLRPRPVCRRGR